MFLSSIQVIACVYCALLNNKAGFGVSGMHQCANFILGVVHDKHRFQVWFLLGLAIFPLHAHSTSFLSDWLLLLSIPSNSLLHPQGCDKFTRNFLTKIGKTVPEDEQLPSDDYNDHRAAVSKPAIHLSACTMKTRACAGPIENIY